MKTNNQTASGEKNQKMATKISTNNQKFVNEAMVRLREILQILKQKDNQESRQKIQQICTRLIKMGEENNYPELRELLAKCSRAMAHTGNNYATLINIVVQEIKQALELLMRGESKKIKISVKLQEIIPDEMTKTSEEKMQKDEEWERSFEKLFETKQPVAKHTENDMTTAKGTSMKVTDFNTLADLFEGDTPELEETWEKEEILDIGSKPSELSYQQTIIQLDNMSFADLFGGEEKAEKTTATDEELMNLFGADFMGGDKGDEMDFLKEQVTVLQPKVKNQTKEVRGDKDDGDDIKELLEIYEQWGNKKEEKEDNWMEEIIAEEDNLLATDIAFEWEITDNSSFRNLEETVIFENIEELHKQENIIVNGRSQPEKTRKPITRELEELFPTEITEPVFNMEEDFNTLLQIKKPLPKSQNNDPSSGNIMEELDALLNEINTETSNVDTEDDLATILQSDLQPKMMKSKSEESIESLFKSEDNSSRGLLDELDALLYETEEMPEKKAMSKPVEVSSFDELDALLSEIEKPEEKQKEIKSGLEGIEALLTETPASNDLPIFVELEALIIRPIASILFQELEKLIEQPNPGGITNKTEITQEKEGNKKTSEDEEDEWERIRREVNEAPPGQTATKPVVKQQKIKDQTMRVSVKNMDNLTNLIGELVVNRNTLEQDQEKMRQSLDNILSQVQQLSEVGARMQDFYERSLLEKSLLASRQNLRGQGKGYDGGSSSSSHGGNGSWEFEEMDVFTPFHIISQEMIELTVRIRESSSDIEFLVDETDQIARQLRQVTTQMQEGLTRARMIPFAQIAEQLPLAVRKIARDYEKEVDLVIEGKEILIDKVILERLYDPLIHLVNNALAHGIESISDRQKAGKPIHGRVLIRAFHQGNETIISITDDGAGIDPEKVKAKAVEKGLITVSEGKKMSRQEVYELLFHNGFSTKQVADNLSGRGVGMDVVRTNVAEMRGNIITDSVLGKGTTFTIRLPLTLSICKALCCVSSKSEIAFPMDGVEDMLDIPKNRIQTNADGKSCINWRDMILPFQPLWELLHFNRTIGRNIVYKTNQEDNMASIVILRSAGSFLAIQVDRVVGEQEIVIKQIEGPVPKPLGIAGATVLGDGRIMPIGDVLELIDISEGRVRNLEIWPAGESRTTEPGMVKTDPIVLIVDDSITVRELLSITFNKAGYKVEQARDGRDAWEKLRAGLPCNIIFCDVEMPKMNGLQLLENMHNDPNLNQIPVAMLTSRTSDKHKQEASKFGAKGYFTKPYLEEQLIDAAQRMMKGENLLNVSALIPV